MTRIFKHRFAQFFKIFKILWLKSVSSVSHSPKFTPRNMNFSIQNIFQKIKTRARQHPKKAIFALVLFTIWIFCLPSPLFDRPLSTVLEDRNGELLGARIADDGQWRFPISDENLPEKYAACVVIFEDKRFWWHPGVDPISIGRAVVQNFRGRQVVSGGSTLTMQVIRMARRNRGRTVIEKIIEICMATRLELTHRKKTILKFYASNAPFGGNVVGLEAASWRYFGKSPQLLSWAEAALLAVLPNSPALIHPGRNRNALLEKRNRLLDKLFSEKKITQTECELAKEETLPAAPLALPQLAPHLLDNFSGSASLTNRSIARNWSTNRTRSTVDRDLQRRVGEILARRQEIYRGNGIHNLAAVVIEVATGEVLAYCGNVPGAGKEHGESVDILTAPRSTGSILKPYLYAFALESGDILPRSLLTDVPTQLGSYKPENFYENYDGLVPARRALVRSLNVPFVLLLRQYGLEKFHHNLRRIGLTTIEKPAEHYGLSLILGGAEASLLDLTNSYAGMARVLGSFYDRNGKYAADDFRPPTLVFQLKNLSKNKKYLQREPQLLSAGAIWHTFEAMQEVERPTSSGEWEMFTAGRRVAWKTGTSFGFRDAWAVGVTPKYAVGIWVGNADGEGRPGLLGVDMAAPVLFEIFAQLPPTPWFDPPFDDMAQAAICQKSGFRAGEFCENDTVWIPKSGLLAAQCPYHKMLHLDAAGQFQVTGDCEPVDKMLHEPFFVVPPLEEFYFRTKNPWYRPPPPFRLDCLVSQSAQNQVPMQLIYPKNFSKIYVPTDLDGKPGSTVFQAAHRESDAEIFWHLDGEYLGATKTFHQMALRPPPGLHVLTLVDKNGYRLEQRFEILGR